MDKDIIRYSEIFRSFQGEGEYTGVPTAWFRFFMCNLQCNGFGQKDPTRPETYILPYQDFDVSTVDRIEDLPVWSYGCDSSYSWAAKYKHLTHTGTPQEVAERLMQVMISDSNPRGTFRHPESNQEAHMCFTGGEPMIKKHQRDMVNILTAFRDIPGSGLATNMPNFITIETNGTQPITPEFEEFFSNRGKFSGELFISCSPKLFTVSGEENKKAIKPENLVHYQALAPKGQLKFVVGPEDRQWEELLRVIRQFRRAGVHYPIWIMPVGATEEGQHNVAAEVSNRALDHGFNVAARVHTYVYGNVIGT